MLAHSYMRGGTKTPCSTSVAQKAACQPVIIFSIGVDYNTDIVHASLFVLLSFVLVIRDTPSKL